ncbi:Hydrolase (HAD superfamily) [Rhodococcus wratislaviensis]|uniref:Hydrolase (HAD superfamily) n=1 Tax=Rhodococcus wratislaviensis TaxID=44752 RepID=A0A402C752_RHOWR|nr:Hydrolase (HAD superfamily) [Rhodococcus wratislaviensis]
MPVVHEIALAELGADFTNTCPPCAPFTVMSDERVHVTATLVPHGPAFPSFAYRFDTEYGSVTFSGDTTVSDNLVELARGSDVLIHEAVTLRRQRPDTGGTRPHAAIARRSAAAAGPHPGSSDADRSDPGGGRT